MNKKRIEIVSKYFTPANAGIEVNILETYKVLAKDWQIIMHTSTDTLEAHDVLTPEDYVAGIKVKRYKLNIFGFYPQIDWKSADVVCLHNFNVFFLPIFLIALWHKTINKRPSRLVVTPHGGFSPEWSVFPPLTRIIKYFYHRFVGSLILNYIVDHIRAVSEWEMRAIIKMGVKASKIVVISNGLEDDAFKNIDKLASADIKQTVKKFGRYLIQVGRIYPIKNYETAIHMLPYIPKDVKYVIVGSEEKHNHYKGYKESLIKLAGELGVKNRLIFTGQVRGVDKYYLIKHSQMMVHMALWESFCNVVHEAMSQGKVCLVANNTALPLLIKNGKNGYCIQTHDSKDLAKRVNFVLSHKESETIKKMERLNAKLGLSVSWQQVARKMHKLYLGGTV